MKRITTRFLVRLWLVVLCSAALTGGVAFAQTVVQSYQATTSMQPGMIVQLVKGNSEEVSPVTEAAMTKMFGVVVDPSDVTVTLNSQNPSQQTYVATSGVYQVLVSTQNGAIKTGDYVTISSLTGIGMKATQSQLMVLGKAVSGFDGVHNVLNTARLKTSGPQKNTTVSIGAIDVSISITSNPFYASQPVYLPGFLSSTAGALGNRQASAFRIYLGLFILIISTIITATMLYASIRNSFVAIGRNPLSRRTIIQGLLQVVAVSVAVFIIGLIAVYLLLRL